MHAHPTRGTRIRVALSALLTTLLLGSAGVTTAHAHSTPAVAPATAAPATISVANAEEEGEWLSPIHKRPRCGIDPASEPFRYGFRPVGTETWITVKCTTYVEMQRNAARFDNNAGYEFKREPQDNSTLAPLPEYIPYLPVEDDDEGDFWLGTTTPQPSQNNQHFKTISLAVEEPEDTEIPEPLTYDAETDSALQDTLTVALGGCDTDDCLPASRLDEAIRDGVISGDLTEWEQPIALTRADDIVDEYIFKRPPTSKYPYVTGCYSGSEGEEYEGRGSYNPVTHACTRLFSEEEDDQPEASGGASATQNAPSLALVTAPGTLLHTLNTAHDGSHGTHGTVTVLLGDDTVLVEDVAADGTFGFALPDAGAGVHTYTLVYTDESDPTKFDHVDVTVIAAGDNAAGDSSGDLTNTPALLITLSSLFGVAIIAVIVMLTRRRV